jgi:hypothetical protein
MGVAVESSRVRLPALVAALLAAAACSGTSGPGATETNATAPLATLAAPSPTIGPTLAPPTQAIARITPLPGAPDSGMSITLIASLGSWNVNALTVPAGKVWHLVMENRDPSIPHNFVIARPPQLQASIFGPTFVGIATMKFAIPGLPAGTYQFICTLHPESMTGVLTIK